LTTPEPSFPPLLLYDLVGEGEDAMRNCQSERGSGLQVDHKFEPGRLLDRQIGGFGALQDLVDERGSALGILLPCLSIG